MGNAQSSASSPACSNGPICRALCMRSTPTEEDDGEWFGELPREKKKRKSTRKSRPSKSLAKMPSVPEERESVCSDTIETNEENGSSIDRVDSNVDSNGSGSPLFAKSLPVGSRSTISGLISTDSPKADKPKVSRRASAPDGNALKTKKANKQRKPNVKLTFVNGQFVDMKTKEGQDLARAASSGDVSGMRKGIATTIASGHAGILGPSPPSSKSSSSSLKAFSKSKSKSSSSGEFDRSVSESSAASSSVTSMESGSSLGTADSSHAIRNKESLSSILVLANGHILTAARCDRVIKMWRVEEVDGKPTIQHVREFEGHKVGVTSLTKVDDKGRFLSASKDTRIKMWDSRMDCKDDGGVDTSGRAHRILLATFDKMDRRNIHDMAIIDEGSYVRPTDKLDAAMAAAMTKKAMKQGSDAVQRAAQERHIIACSCEFATISGRHKVVKLWSVKHVENQEGLTPEDNVAEVTLELDIKHKAVVESIVSVRGKGILLTGDRMGDVRLWRAAKNVFIPGSARIWTCARTFSWRLKSDLATSTESMQFAITSLSFLQGNTMFVSGSKSGNLRVWKTDGANKKEETVNKEVICITGAHSESIPVVQQGPQVGRVNGSLTFSSASEDGKILSFAVPAEKDGSTNPSCFHVVNHNIANRFVIDAEALGVTTLACLNIPNKGKDVLITGSTDGNINILKDPIPSKQDALISYRQSMEDESLTLRLIAEKVSKGGVETRNRKLNMMTYKNCFVGKELVSYLVENEYAVSRQDAVELGRVLATHLSLLECCKKGKLLQDEPKAYYRWSGDYSLGLEKMKKFKTAPNLEDEVRDTM